MKSIRIHLSLVLLLLCGFAARANHLLGGEINYKFISSSGDSSVYRVTLSFYADCFSNIPGGAYTALPGASPEIYIYKGAGTYNVITLDYADSLSNVEITPVCPDEADNTACSNITNPIPGVTRWVYSSNVTLRGTDSNWRFAFMGTLSSQPLPTSAGRSLIIENAEVFDPLSGNTTVMYLESTLNNTLGYNNSTTFLSPPTPFFCLNKAADYSLGAADPDYDSLHFTLIPGKTVDYSANHYSDLVYIPPYTGQEPLPTAPGSFFFSNVNGQMSFTPNLVMNCLVTNLVEEYRNGVKVGSSTREMTFVILDNCNNDAPTSPVTNIQHANIEQDAAGNLYLSVCEGQTNDISFDIHSVDPNSDNVFVSYANLPTGATITLVNDSTAHPDLHFEWNLNDAPPGNYIFYITYLDDGCPLASRKTIAYTIRVIPYAITFNEGFSGACDTQSNGKAWVAPAVKNPTNFTYTWVDVNGNVLRDVQSSNGDTLTAVPVGTYKVYIRDAGGCGHNVMISISEMPQPTVQLPADTTVCQAIPITLSSTATPDIKYLWNTGDTSCCIIAHKTGTYILEAINQCGFGADTVNLKFVPCDYCLFVPNAFSPNGDGRNDQFVVLPTCIIAKYNIRIFNRWGQLVFYSINMSKSWDGTFHNRPAETGTYFYEIEATSDDATKAPITLKGDIVLIR